MGKNEKEAELIRTYEGKEEVLYLGFTEEGRKILKEAEALVRYLEERPPYIV